ncbi:MAG: MlaD family protein [Leptospiraceae bacterium]|nr:MlaD family protein [Leptospiraceae bacterium]MDW8306591.1 MlaD family protein [Leptospiraceae bacterium]
MISTRRKAIYAGLIVVLLAFLTGFLIAFAADLKLKKSGFRIRVTFSFLNNLNKGAPVLAAGGLPVGFVEDIYQKDLQTYVQLYLYDILRHRLPKRKETQISVFSRDLLGEKYINIFIPEARPGDTFLDEGDTWYGIDPPSMEKMMLSFSAWFREGEASQVLDDIANQARQLRSMIKQIILENEEDMRFLIEQGRVSVDSISHKLQLLLSELGKIAADYDELTKKSREDSRLVMENLTQIMQTLGSIRAIFLAGQGSLGKLVKGRELQKNTGEAINHARAFIRCIREEPWVLIYKEPCKN